MTEELLAEVVLPLPIDRIFHYLPPKNGGEALPVPKPLSRVSVPFGRARKLGIVIGYSREAPLADRSLKRIDGVLDVEPVLTPEMLDLARWMARRYACSLGEALFSLLPPRSKRILPLGLGRPVSLPANGLPKAARPEGGESLELTPDQSASLESLKDALTQKTRQTFVLWGVAAAGKTEIYLRATEVALSLGGGVIALVPEISLTAQLVPVFESRFPGLVAIWHSGVSPSTKKGLWEDIRMGRRRIVLGARSAVLAPVKNLGLIILDEEHDPSYKEDSKPRYHARDLAIQRGALSSAVVILGSATPSLESYQAALDGRYNLLKLPLRVAGEGPRITLVDMRKERPGTVVSQTLKKAVGERLKNREQSILFLNRRGFYRFCRCSKCGWCARCPSCALALVSHSDSSRSLIRCHACIYRIAVPARCEACGHASLWMGGAGTQRVFSEIEREFPWAHVLRWDMDVTGKRGSHERLFESVKSRQADIVVGTRMVAQGLDFPGVALVGVIDADVALHRPDFRAAERTFQLLVQVAGRSGRGEKQGEVIIQTREPDEPALQYAARMDFDAFARAELLHRRELRYPPYSRLIQLILAGRRETAVERESEALLKALTDLPLPPGVECLGPAPALHPRRSGRSRAQLLIKGEQGSLGPVLACLKAYRPKEGVRLLIDADPEELR